MKYIKTFENAKNELVLYCIVKETNDIYVCVNCENDDINIYEIKNLMFKKIDEIGIDDVSVFNSSQIVDCKNHMKKFLGDYLYSAYEFKEVNIGDFEMLINSKKYNL